ncbi:conserved exported protein of unknown function [Legionella pneumophila subsp. pneumophila]|uniref:hypothetical protein n=1 Tax=Legionella pneumophila TaxID=446 RepID=UPI00026D9631|nr:hypothetical protein [Legionella pneumophila]CCD08915.1 conserved exported protein of unknown function [Legionella pneumophila subsp. pneumophila]
MKTGTVLGLRLFLAVSIGFWGMGLVSCASTQATTEESHPESQYAGGFGGNGEHIHELHPKKAKDI